MKLFGVNKRMFIYPGVALMLGVLAMGLGSCGDEGKNAGGSTGTSTAAPLLSREEILAGRADAVFSSIGGAGDEYPQNLITAPQLAAKLQDPAEAEKLYILDTRPRGEWEKQGHIEGANWMKMQDVAAPENLAKLPRDKQIVCVSPTGHTAVQVMTTLRWLGYDAVALEFGYASWIKAGGNKLITSDVQNGMAKRYPVAFEAPFTAAVPQEPDSELAPPPDDQFDTLAASARQMLSENVFEKEYPFNHIFADELYRRLSDPALRDSIFVLDIRPLDAWERDGHIDIGPHDHIDWRVLAEAPNLARLPKDKLIVVVGATGQTAGQVTPILRMLGYNAVTLRSGMTAWTETPDSQPTLDAMANADYPVVQ